jgi:hypothetical protein
MWYKYSARKGINTHDLEQIIVDNIEPDLLPLYEIKNHYSKFGIAVEDIPFITDKIPPISGKIESIINSSGLFPFRIKVIIAPLQFSQYHSTNNTLYIRTKDIFDLRNLRYTLKHELIHALDKDLQLKPDTPPPSMQEYANDPHEIRAAIGNMIQVITDIIEEKERQITNSEFVDMLSILIQKMHMQREMVTPQNKRAFFETIYNALSSKNLISQTPQKL